MILNNQETFPVEMPQQFANSKRSYMQHVFSTDGLAGYNRRERLQALYDTIAKEPFGEPYALPLLHLYLFQIAPDGTFVFFERQTQNAWTDLKWHLSGGFYSVKKQKRLDLPSNSHLADDLWAKRQEDPQKYEILAQWIKEMYEHNQFPDWDDIAKMSFNIGVDVGHLLMCINVAFLEQDNKNHGGLGYRMPYSLFPLTKQEMDATFDLNKGIFTAREVLRYLFHSDMDLTDVCQKLNDKFCHTKRTFVISEIDSSITFTKQDMEFVVTYGLNNNLLVMDNITLNKTGIHILIKENHNNQDDLSNWFHSYFSSTGIYDGKTKYSFEWGDATLVDGFVDVRLKQNWDAKELYKKVKQFKK